MRLCRQCGEVLLGDREFCDKVCETLYKGTYKKKKAKKQEKAAPDKFDNFVAAQTRARAQGKKYTYGDWQRENYAPVVTVKKESGIRPYDGKCCKDCKHFIEDKYGKNICEKKPYVTTGRGVKEKKAYHPNKYYRACSRYFEPAEIVNR